MSLETRIAKLVAEAIHNYSMIESGDKILLGFSGGKDSYTLLDFLLRLQKLSPVKFQLTVAIIDSGFKSNYSKAEKYLKSRAVNYLIKKTDIQKTVTSKIGSKDTGKCCALCSRLRRGTLYKIAKEKGCNKLALGHNLDDAIETLFLNMIYNSKPSILRPRYLSDTKKITIIRPLITVPEQHIREYVLEKKFPIVKQICLYKKEDSRRLQLKKFMTKLSKDNPYVYPSLTKTLTLLDQRE